MYAITARGIIALLLLTQPAAAHGLDGTDFVATWTYDPWVVIPLYLSALLYLVGTNRLWQRAGPGRGLRYWQVACFWAGWTSLALALLSPLHWLGERLFVAHMVEHTILMVVAAPLIAVSRPSGAILWGLPRAVRRTLGALTQSRPVAGIWSRLRAPLTATLIQAVALWAWHMPALYNLVLTNVAAHRLQHLSFTGSAMLFWWALWHGQVRSRGYGINIGCLFVTSLHTGVLGALLTVSRRLWFPAQIAFATDWGLTPLEDQQLAGLVMWVPMGLIYTAAGLYFAGQWIAGSSRGAESSSHVALAR